MAYQKFLIAPYKTGLDKSVEPWMLPEDSFAVMTNAFIHNGYVRKKFGYNTLGRLQEQVTGASSSGTTIGPYTATLTTPVAPGTVGIYDGITLDATDAGDGTFTASATIASGTINYATGEVSVTYKAAGTPAGSVTFNYDYYPMSPCMGICQRETIYDNRETTVIFDRTNSYEWSSTKWATTTTTNDSWSGDTYNFFWGCNYYYDSSANKYFWVTNNKAYSLDGSDKKDGIKFYDGTNWDTLNPLIGSSDRLGGCLIILPFKGRLITLRTIETSSDTVFYQRARWSQPLVTPTGANAWRSDLIGYGGYVDAATSENIISAKVIGGRLIVHFEKSVWELFYTGIKAQPFTFRQISAAYGCEAPYSIVEEDNKLFGIGQNAITVCDGNTIQKIDQKLDKDIYTYKNSSNAKFRFHGIKDSLYKLIYWTLPINKTYPSNLLVYNYDNGSFSYYNGSFSYYDDNFTALGYHQLASDYTWTHYITPAGGGDNIYRWSKIGMKWSSMVSEAGTNNVIAGNQQGFIQQFYFTSISGASLHITGFTNDASEKTIKIESADHNLSVIYSDGVDRYVKFSNVTGIDPTYDGSTVAWSTLTFKIVTTSDSDDDNFVVAYPTRQDSSDDGEVKACTFLGTYTGGGTVAKMFNFNITTKKFNPIIKESEQIKIGNVDLYVTSTSSGEVTLDTIVDDVDYIPPSSRFVKSINLPTSRQSGQLSTNKHWNRALINSRGQFLQLKFSLSEKQMLSTVRDSAFELHAMNLHIAKAGNIIGLK